MLALAEVGVAKAGWAKRATVQQLAEQDIGVVRGLVKLVAQQHGLLAHLILKEEEQKKEMGAGGGGGGVGNHTKQL